MHNAPQPNAFRPGHNMVSPDSLIATELILLPFEPGRHAITFVKRDQPLRDIGGTPFPCALVSVLPGPGRAAFPSGQTGWLLSPGDTLTMHVQATGAILTMITMRPSDYASTGLQFKITHLDGQPQATAAGPAWNPAPPFEVVTAERPQPQPAFGQPGPAPMPFGADAQPREAFPPGGPFWRQNAPAPGEGFPPVLHPGHSPLEAHPGSGAFGPSPFAAAPQPPAAGQRPPLAADLSFAAPLGAFPDAPRSGHRPGAAGAVGAASPAHFQPFQAVAPQPGHPADSTGLSGVPEHPAAAPVSLHACGHIQNIGDAASLPGQTIGAPGSRVRLEAVAFKPEGMDPAALEYATISHDGLLSPWVSFPHFSGTRGAGLPLLGFVARLTGEAARLYDVAYSGTFLKTGQSRSCRNGEFLFSNADGDALESLAVRIVPKG